MAAARLSIQNLDKSFSVPVLTGINLTVKRGEIHGLVGENGAGKTTFGSILAGFVSKDNGTITLDGVEYEPSGPKDAFQAGISCAAQELSLINPLSVTENIALRKLPHSCSVISGQELEQRTRSILQRVGLGSLDPDTRTGTLGLAERQLVEFAKAVFLDCRVLILDEPTSALDVSIQAQILGLLKNLQETLKLTYLFISHDLAVVNAVADEVAVMYRGQIVEYGPSEQVLHSPRHAYTQELKTTSISI